MARFERFDVTLFADTSAGATSATYYTPSINGTINMIAYTTFTSALPTTSKLSIVSENAPAQIILSSGRLATAFAIYPGRVMADTTGGPGGSSQMSPIPLVNDRLVISFIPGSTVGTGTFTFIVDGQITNV